VDGAADAAAFIAMVSILMKLYPDKVATVMSLSDAWYGFGYVLGTDSGNFIDIFFSDKYLNI
jgi:hypothetical protein